MDVRKMAENDASDSFNLASPKLAHTYIRTDILISLTRYDVTNYFLSEATAKKTVENAA